jgi:hypothetical protein
MGDATRPGASIEASPIQFCPICGTPCTPAPAAKASSAITRCASCGFDLSLAMSQAPVVPTTAPSRVPRFAYLMLVAQCAASLLIAWALISLGSPSYLMTQQFLAVLSVLSVAVLAVFCLWLRRGRAISWARRALFVLGLVTVPFGVCAMAAAVSVAGPQRYCSICLRRLGWSEHYSTCPHCMASFHRYDECRQARRRLIAQAWGREPTGEEIDDTCPFCFHSLRREPGGGGPG